MGSGAGGGRGEELASAKLRLKYVAAGEGAGGNGVADRELGARAGRRVGGRHCGRLVGLPRYCR